MRRRFLGESFLAPAFLFSQATPLPKSMLKAICSGVRGAHGAHGVDDHLTGGHRGAACESCGCARRGAGGGACLLRGRRCCTKVA
ncbi:unnamed protein product [Chondrus crispus]|uniref:Uncharacterized protein n=1 Tax=Chondrus crispus TaxID=2769 RepID=R7QNZ3_CHOCR|nr:unnamed protein product [Chondrus crispus]CDF39819.1 unnamed protein product [Chondrus crispus]|eukprot:XP_005710113.1 unnamed protein product [Chondrus crispus]